MTMNWSAAVSVSLLESQPGWKVVAEADNGHAAIEMVKQHSPDIAILDMTMPVLDGLAATREIHQNMPKVRVLILTMHSSKQLVRELLDAGARGYVMKSDAARDLIKAIGELLEQAVLYLFTA